MAVIADKKADQVKWTGLFVFDLVLKDAVARYWSTRTVTYNGHGYESLISEFSPLTVQSQGIYGVDSVIELSLTLNNAALNLDAVITPANVQGGTIQPRFIFVDPDSGATTTDAIVYPQFIFDLPTERWPRIVLSAHNKWNFARKQLPVSVITRKDRYPFPDTLAQRSAGYSDPTSPYYAIGYSPENGQGNWKTPPDVPYTSSDYDGTREKLEEIGLSARFGGFGKMPPSISYTPRKGEHGEFKGSANEGKYGAAVPLAFGICRTQPPVLDTGGPSDWNGARLSHLLLSDGVNYAPDTAYMGIQGHPDGEEWRMRVWVTELNGRVYEVPRTSGQASVTGSWAFYGGYYGSQVPNQAAYRNIIAATDLPAPDYEDRDLYSGLAFLSLGLPKELAFQDSATGPKVEVLFYGLKIETWDAALTSTWQWSDNPVWIFVHLLKLLGWSTADMDKSTIYSAAAYCDEALANGKKRFRCNLALMSQMKAADVLRGIRNNCRMYTTFGNDGKLQLRIARTLAGEGGSAFAITSANIAREVEGRPLPPPRKFHKSVFETANSFSCNFQNEDNSYVSDTYAKSDLDNIDAIGERISGDSITAVLGIPSFDQAERILNWLKYEHVDLNEFYEVVGTQALIEQKVGQIGTITETRLGLTNQQCRIRAITPGPGDTVRLLLQKHGDAGYTDDSTVTPADRARSDSTYSPRSVGNVACTELFVQDDQKPDVYHRKIKCSFTPPPAAFSSGFGSRAKISDVQVQTTGGSIAGNQVLFVEVCPTLSGAQGQATDYLLANVPAGTNTNKFTFDLTLPEEADGYIVRVGSYPGRLFEQATVLTASKSLTVTVSDISGLDQTDLSPDPFYDHARIFYYYDGSPDILRDGARTNADDETEITFQPEPPEAADTQITVIVCSANAKETDFYPAGLAPSATLSLTKDTGNPAGASGLTILTSADDAAIPQGCMVFQFNRDTSNYQSILGVEVRLSTALPGQGPYSAERAAFPAATIEGPITVTTVAGSKTVTCTRAASASVVNRPLVIFTNDGTPDSDLEGSVIEAQGVNYYQLTTPFSKSGSYTAYVLKRWWDRGTSSETANSWYEWFPIEKLGDRNQTVWRTPPMPYPVGSFYATACSKNPFGVGERITSAQATFTAVVIPTDSVVPDAPVVAIVKEGVLSAAIGIQKPGGSPDGWLNVTKLTVEVATDAAFTSIAQTLEKEGQLLTAELFPFLSETAGKFYARGRAMNSQGDSSNSTTQPFETDTSAGDTTVPSAPTVTLYNASDQGSIAPRTVKCRVAFAGCTNIGGLWGVWVQFHTSSTFTHPEASPVYSPGTSKGTIVKGGTTLVDASEAFAGVSVGDVIMLSYDDPWPGSPATNVFLAAISGVASGVLTIDKPGWSQPSGDYTYRIVKGPWDASIDSGPGYFHDIWSIDSKARSRGYVEFTQPLPASTNIYARAWIFNLFGRSPASVASAAKQALQVQTADVANGAVTPDILSGPARSQNGIRETFEALPSGWTIFSEASGATRVLQTGIGETGGNAIRVTRGYGEFSPAKIPFDPSKLYRIRARVRRHATVSAEHRVYIGVAAFQADGSTYQNHDDGYPWYYLGGYVDLTPYAIDEWVVMTRWFMGVSDTSSSGSSSDPTAPYPLHTGTKYISVLYLSCYTSTNDDVTDIDEISIDVIDEDVADRTYRGLMPGGANLKSDGGWRETFEKLPDWREATASGVQAIVDAIGQTGGKAFRSTGYYWAISKDRIPYDASKLYRIRARVKRNTGGTTGTIYVGLCGYLADGVTKCNINGADSDGSQHYICASNATPTADTWVDYTGWFKGWGATGDSSPSTDPTDPQVLHQNVRYMSPLFILNYSTGTESVDIDEIAIDVFDEVGALALYLALNTYGVVKSNKVVTDSLNALAVTAAKVAASAIETDKLANLAVTGGKIAARTIEAGKIVASTLTAYEIAASTITGGNIAALTIEAGNIAASTITGGKIAALTITSGLIGALQITSGKLAADAIDAMTITGATIRSAASGARLEITSTGLRTYNSGGTQTGSLSSGDAFAGLFFNSLYTYTAGASLALSGESGVTLRYNGSSRLTIENTYVAITSGIALKIGTSDVINSSKIFVGSGVNVGSNTIVGQIDGSGAAGLGVKVRKYTSKPTWASETANSVFISDIGGTRKIGFYDGTNVFAVTLDQTNPSDLV